MEKKKKKKKKKLKKMKINESLRKVENVNVHFLAVM